jgi:hypothetical protein
MMCAAAKTKKKHKVWVPSSTGSHIGGRWIEVDEGDTADSGALNVKRGSAEALQQEQLRLGPKNVPGGGIRGALTESALRLFQDWRSFG